MRLSELLEGAERTGDGLRFAIPDEWAQGRTAYGGLTAATSAHAARALTGIDVPLRSVQTAFIGPAAGEATIRIRLLRQGRSTTFVEADLYTDDEIRARSTMVFGAARESAVQTRDFPLPDFPPRGSEKRLEPTALHPRFLRQFEIEAADRYQPFEGKGEGIVRWWVRHKEEALRTDPVGLLCLADVPPPAVSPLMPGLAPVSSVAWHHDFLSDDLSTEDGWYQVESRAEAAADGWSTQAMGIWSSDGRPIASGRQSVVVFA